MATTLIAFTGKAGSGKSEAASYLTEGYGFSLVKFAGPLKAMLRGFYTAVGLPEEEIDRRLEGDLKEVPDPFLSGRTPRHAMETLGTEWGRLMMDADFWLNAAERRIEVTEGPVVIDDCRFANEAHTVRRLGGSVVRVKATEDRREVSEHQAEKGLHDGLVDHDILNGEGIGNLRQSIDSYLYGC